MVGRSRSEVESEIKETLGLVPHFFSLIPDEALPASEAAPPADGA